MNKYQLEKYADDFLRKHFEMSLQVPVRVSGRMRTTFGSFRFSVLQSLDLKTPREIAMSKEFMENYTKSEILDVLYHECVHYALFEQGKPFRDGDDYFKATLDRLGISRTRTYRYRGTAFEYVCNDCGNTVKKRMKGYEKRYICGSCHGDFERVGTVIV